MVSQRVLADVRTIMIDFADRTGLLTAGNPEQRYLWTDAFAVCAFLSLFRTTGDEEFRRLATRLIDQVHETLGQHRQDDTRVGWISGLDEDEARRHPTAGGLRIGKRFNERAKREPFDERQEWDRDGQYFHYLTKWMHALERAAVVTSNATYCRWAIELAQTAHAAFTYETTNGGVPRMYWKMSIDLSRALVPSMGHHDPLDAFVTYSELEHYRAAQRTDCELPDLQAQISEAAAMCAGQSWASEDPLGLGGLLIDAYRIGQLQTTDVTTRGPALAQLLSDARAGLLAFVNSYPLHAPADYRLAFREFGLAIGLHAVKALQERIDGDRVSTSDPVRDELVELMRFLPVAEQIESFWRQPANQSASTWLDHRDINSVMLAASLLPEQFLLV